MNKSFEDLMSMSDEELLNSSDTVAEEITTTEENNETNDEGGDTPDTTTTETTEETGGEVEGEGDEDIPDTAKTDDAKGKTDDKTKGAVASGSPEGDKVVDNKDAKVTDNTVTDYEAAYKNIMKPFKANGREVALNSPEEAIKLMQMGANYAKKMQAIQPNLKVLRMLEKSDMLDEGKLSELIDLVKGDKAALAKFVKDRNIDPMDIDPETAVNYKPGNHKVADSEITFQTTLDDLNSSDAGQSLIIQMQHSWDAASRQEVFKEPAHLRTLELHMANGIYDQIASEVEKQKALGHPQLASMPFIKAYEVVGKALAENNLLKPKTVTPSNVDTTVQVKAVKELGRGVAPNKKGKDNGEKVKAALPSGKSTKKAAADFNPLAGSDEEFLAELNNRV